MSARRGAELATFAALAAFAAGSWVALIADPPLGRAILAALIATAGGAALTRVGSRSRPARLAAGIAIVAVTLAATLVALGLPVRLLAPWNWDEFRAQLSTGLEGISKESMPYGGGDVWTRLGIVLGAAPVLTAAAALAFWPRRDVGPARRAGALVALVGLYAVSVTWEAPPAELARGLVLLALVAAWIWLPGLPLRRLVPAGATVLVTGGLAVALAAPLASADPLVNYRDWTLFGAEREITYDWNHTYGPLEWPQRGTTVLEMRAERPLYWRTAVLDLYDGFRWLRSGDEPDGPREAALAGASAGDLRRHQNWVEFPGVQVRALSSELLVSAGTTLRVEGLSVDETAAQGTVNVADGSLERGDSYSVAVYAPDPSPSQMRRAPQALPAGLARYTTLQLPGVRNPLLEIPAEPSLPLSTVDTRPGQPANVTFANDVAGNYYRRVYELTQRLTAGAPTHYDAVRAVENYLRETYDYNQSVPRHLHPLPSFLFDDRAGYCQQFSGAMALMLRLAGIPSRVATGFAPGSSLENGSRYEVSDFDAHSWVEVYFPTIGWVTFDPTPGAAPAQSLGSLAVRPRGDVADERFRRVLGIESDAESDPGSAFGSGQGSEESGPPWGQIAVLVLAAGLAVVFWSRRRRLLAPEGAAPQLRELERALPRIGWELPAGSTLLGIEERLRAAAGPDASRYVGGLRANRYGPNKPKRPGPAERRALRAALSRGRGLRHRLRVLFAIPPGGPGSTGRTGA